MQKQVSVILNKTNLFNWKIQKFGHAGTDSYALLVFDWISVFIVVSLQFSIPFCLALCLLFCGKRYVSLLDGVALFCQQFDFSSSTTHKFTPPNQSKNDMYVWCADERVVLPPHNGITRWIVCPVATSGVVISSTMPLRARSVFVYARMCVHHQMNNKLKACQCFLESCWPSQACPTSSKFVKTIDQSHLLGNQYVKRWLSTAQPLLGTRCS